MADELPQPQPSEAEKPVRHLSHGYQEDLSQAMNATDATVVQELLHEAHDREEETVIENKERLERKWYVFVSLFLFFAALIGAAYGIYHYQHLTVPVEQTISVGVFPSTQDFVAGDTTIESVIATLALDNTLKDKTPYLVSLVTDRQSLSLISNKALLGFIGADVSEPFLNAFDVLRLGVMKNGAETTPFIIGSVKDPVVATKELLIDEPNLLQQFHRAVAIPATALPKEVGQGFIQEYRYNLPIRTLSIADIDGTSRDLFLYGFATNNILVMTTDPYVLKVISDTIIRQQ